MNPMRRVYLRLMLARRLRAFKQALGKGMSIEQARAWSHNLYPPTPEQAAYEESLRRRHLKRTSN